MIWHRPWRLFHRSLALFVGLGVSPVLIIAIAFALPHPLDVSQSKMLIGLLLIASTMSTLCLAGLVVRTLKQPIQQLLTAQHEIKNGNFAHRLDLTGSYEMQQLFHGFNNMASAVAIAAEHEKQMAEERSLAKLSSQVVHDLRSPLVSLKLACDYFTAQQERGEEFRDYTKVLELGIQRLRSIAEALLNQRKESAAQSPTLLQGAIIDLLSEIKARKHADLTFQTCFHQPAIPVAASKIEIQRVIGNIITNAMEAMRAVGKISITTVESGIGVGIQIQDDGPGMTPDILQKVLQGGFTHGKANGNGIGMTVVREIVEKYQGRLDAMSTPGRGTMFVVELPLYSTAR